MTYVAVPTDSTRPLDSDDASGGAAELRALKAYIQTLVSGSIPLTGYSWQGGRNRIRNGAVRLDQHQVGAGVVGSTGQQLYGPDGYKIVYSQTSKLAIGLAATGVIAGGVLGPIGCPNYVVVATNTAVAAPVAGDFFALELDIEDYLMFDFNYGQSSAKAAFVSFWWRASIAGDYAVAFRRPTGPRSYPTKFTYNTANTWQLINIQVPGDLTTLMTTTTAAGIRLWFDLGSGTNFNAVNPNQWNANDLFKVTGCVEPIKTLGATIHISKVQLEQDAFTPFEFLNIETDLGFNQRYFEQMPVNGRIVYNQGPNGAMMDVIFNTIKRTTVSLNYVGAMPTGEFTLAATSVVIDRNRQDGVQLLWGGAGGPAAGTAGRMLTGGTLQFSAEL